MLELDLGCPSSMLHVRSAGFAEHTGFRGQGSRGNLKTEMPYVRS